MAKHRAPPTAVGEHTGMAYGVGAQLIWGLFPAYWPLLLPTRATEILAHRIAWSLAVMLIVTMVLRRWQPLIGLSRRGWLMVASAAVLITVNWGTLIYAVNTRHVVESALGYFITPLVSVLLGVVVLGERLRGARTAAVTIAVLAVVVLTLDYGRLPWISLVLALSFGGYGLVKKTVPLDSAASLTAETMIIGPAALGYLFGLPAPTFGSHGPGHALLLMGSGVVTAVPLLLFGAGARRVRLVTLGMLQYLAPVLQFGWGVFVAHEPMPASRWIGFALVWLSLLVFTVDAVRNSRDRQPARRLT
ncbi:MAG TPA: EamA family transporter RarD [Actinophytocola sp.]|jgi:chloramphenicol-sensitive protein RarD|uniref:EamA family transporter RarD n=1 Tax=Actinophytocola sp. TaxID=1872138 RepID=UPI002DF8FDDC|nr:EamA family transporter RarD [Actinophytocola sp.]